MDNIAAFYPAASTNQLAESRAKRMRGEFNAKDKQNIDKIAEDFEAVFLSQMMQNMFEDVDFDPMNDGPGEDVYKSMLVDEYGKILSRAGGIGIASHVKREMLAAQENR